MTQASAYREVLFQQLFLLNANLNNAILRTRDECVQIWELQLVGVELRKLYSLQELQASYKAAAKVTSLDKHRNVMQNCMLKRALSHKRLATASLDCPMIKSGPGCHPAVHILWEGFPDLSAHQFCACTCIAFARLQHATCVVMP